MFTELEEILNNEDEDGDVAIDEDAMDEIAIDELIENDEVPLDDAWISEEDDDANEDKTTFEYAWLDFVVVNSEDDEMSIEDIFMGLELDEVLSAGSVGLEQENRQMIMKTNPMIREQEIFINPPLNNAELLSKKC